VVQSLAHSSSDESHHIGGELDSLKRVCMGAYDDETENVHHDDLNASIPYSCLQIHETMSCHFFYTMMECIRDT
jgi:hypothetical protein